MADNILREFLVKVGYKVDSRSQQDADSSIENTTLYVRRLGFAVAAAGAAVAAGAAKMSSHLSSLGYSAERTRSTVEGIRGIQYAAEQLGSSGQEALSAIEGLSQQIRRSPGTENLLQRLGVQTRDANGELRGSVDLLKQFGQVTRDMPMFQAQAYAQSLGIPEKLLLAMRNGDFDDYMEQYERRSKNLDLGDAADKAQELQRQLNTVRQQFVDIGLAATGNIQETVEPLLDRLTVWAREEGPGIAERVGEDTEKIIGFVKTMMTWYDKADAVVRKWTESFNDAQDYLSDHNLQTWSSKQDWMRSDFGDNSSMGVGEFVARSIAAASGMDWFKSMFPGISKDATSAVKADEAVALKRRTAHAMRFFVSQGMSPQQASGIVSNLIEESNLDPGARGDGGKAYGIAQWHPSRRGDFTNWTGKNMGHSSFDEQLAFVLYELNHKEKNAAEKLMRARDNSGQSAAVIADYYERHGGGASETQERVDRAQRIYHETTIHVNGTDSPQSVAQEVKRVQDQSNAATVRNTNAPAR